MSDLRRRLTVRPGLCLVFFWCAAWVATLSAQEFTFLGQRTQGLGDAVVRVEIVDPGATTGDTYRVSFNEVGGTLQYSIENVTQQTLVVDSLALGRTSPVFDGIQVRVAQSKPQYRDLVEVRYGSTPVEPPVPIFRPGDRKGEGGNNSTGEYTFVGAGGSGGLDRISRGGIDEMRAAPFDYELRFDGDPEGRNRFIYGFTGSGIINVPFSLWNVGIATPNDAGDDHQIIAVGFDDSGNSSKYDGGASPSDGGPGTMYDRIYFFEIDSEALPQGDINKDGVVNYDDFLQDILNLGDALSQPQTLFNRPYILGEVVGRFSLVALSGDPNYLPPVGTTIRITTTKPPSENDLYEFSTPKFGLFTHPTSLSFGNVKVESRVTRPLIVANGNATVVSVTNVVSSVPEFQSSQNTFTLAPGESLSLEISFSPSGLGPVNGELTISSNDPFFPRYKIELTGEGLPKATGPIDLLGRVDISASGATDVWGYAEAGTGSEFALVGAFDGVVLVDATDPAQARVTAKVVVGTVFDAKPWQHYAYTVNGGATGNGFVIDVQDPSNPVVVGSFPSGHNLFITDGGYMIKEIPGLQVFDLNQDPTQPKLVWQGGVEGHDASVIGNRLYDFHGSAGTFIYDFSNPANPVLLGSITDPAIRFHHSGWISKDGRYLFICDELATHPSPDITVWDIADPANPKRVGEFGDDNATVHNLYIIGDFAFLSYYTAGFRVLDVSDPTKPKLFDEFDTSPEVSGEAFTGAWGVYPFTPSGNVYVSDTNNGLFIFSVKGVTTAISDNSSAVPEQFALFDNYPNPFNPETIITYQLPHSARVQVAIFNLKGQQVRALVNQIQATGTHSITWDGKDDRGQPVTSGIYFYQLKSGDFRVTKRMLLLK